MDGVLMQRPIKPRVRVVFGAGANGDAHGAEFKVEFHMYIPRSNQSSNDEMNEKMFRLRKERKERIEETRQKW